MSIEANKTLVCRLIAEVWNTGNYDHLDTFVAPDIVASMTRLNIRNRAAFPPWETTIEDMVAEGDRVAVCWTARGTHQGEHMGIAPTGKPVTMSGMHFFRIADGKIVERRAEVNLLGVLQQLGALPVPRRTEM